MNKYYHFKWQLPWSGMILIAGLLLSFHHSLGESPQKLKANEDATREYMVEISRHLGVTCTHCHNVDNFSENSKNSFKVSLEHIKIVQVLKSNGMDGKNKKPEATCYMCHRGKLKPDYLEKDKNR